MRVTEVSACPDALPGNVKVAMPVIAVAVLLSDPLVKLTAGTVPPSNVMLEIVPNTSALMSNEPVVERQPLVAVDTKLPFTFAGPETVPLVFTVRVMVIVPRKLTLKVQPRLSLRLAARLRWRNRPASSISPPPVFPAATAGRSGYRGRTH